MERYRRLLKTPAKCPERHCAELGNTFALQRSLDLSAVVGGYDNILSLWDATAASYVFVLLALISVLQYQFITLFFRLWKEYCIVSLLQDRFRTFAVLCSVSSRNTLQSLLLIFLPRRSEVGVQEGHKGSEKEIRTHRTTEEGGTKVKMKLTSRDLNE